MNLGIFRSPQIRNPEHGTLNKHEIRISNDPDYLRRFGMAFQAAAGSPGLPLAIDAAGSPGGVSRSVLLQNCRHLFGRDEEVPAHGASAEAESDRGLPRSRFVPA